MRRFAHERSLQKGALDSSGGSNPSSNRLNMYRLPVRLLSLGALSLACGYVACGAPAELDKGLFPAPDETGYANAAGGAGGASSGGKAGSGSNAQAGSASVASAGSANSGSAGSGSMTAGGCPSDASTLFNRPAEQGGCASTGCHVPGGTPPDLVSPGVASRLLDKMSSCQGLSYIGSTVDSSFIAKKISSSPPCGGARMPFLQPQSLSDADRTCILNWITSVGGGG